MFTSRFYRCFVCCCAFAWLHSGQPIFADGLIYQLPPDGTFAEFRGELTAEATLSVDKELLEKLDAESKAKLHQSIVDRNFTVTISSVGQTQRAGQPCRWIEMTSSIPPEDHGVAGAKELKDDDRRHLLKVLVPEKFLKRGEDPLEHAILTFFNQKDRDRNKLESEPGFSRIRYELERFRPVFPQPLANVKSLPKKTIKTPVGTFTDCEVISGVTELDAPLLGADGKRMEFQEHWTIALHPNAPFGVVEMAWSTVGAEVSSLSVGNLKAQRKLTLSRIGSEAKSAYQEWK